MRSSRVVRASGFQCQSPNSPGFDPRILRLSGIWGAADNAVLNNIYNKLKKSSFKPKKSLCPSPTWPTYICSSTVSPHVSSNRFLCPVPSSHSLFLLFLMSVRICITTPHLTTRLRKSACHGPNIFKDTKPNPKFRLFLRLTSKGILGDRCLSVWGPLPPRILFWVVKQFCRFRIWSNTHCIPLVYAFHTTRSPPPCYTLNEYIPLYLFTQGRGEGG